MHEWHRILKKVIVNGVQRPDRTGVGTMSVFGEQLTFDNRHGTFPAVTTKQLAFRQMAGELAAFLEGAESLDAFHRHGCSIWDGNGLSEPWASERARFPGDLGRVYGVQWRRWLSPRLADLGGGCAGTVAHVEQTDQLVDLCEGMLADPFGRRHLVSAWNPGELGSMCLPPCHVLFQAYVVPENDVMHVDLRVDMRSVDLFLGLPFDIASYALLQKLLTAQLNTDDPSARVWAPRWLIFQLGDAHIYNNHKQQVLTVLGREPLDPPNLVLETGQTLLAFNAEKAKLSCYKPHAPVPAPLNV